MLNDLKEWAAVIALLLSIGTSLYAWLTRSDNIGKLECLRINALAVAVFLDRATHTIAFSIALAGVNEKWRIAIAVAGCAGEMGAAGSPALAQNCTNRGSVRKFTISGSNSNRLIPASRFAHARSSQKKAWSASPRSACTCAIW